MNKCELGKMFGLPDCGNVVLNVYLSEKYSKTGFSVSQVPQDENTIYGICWECFDTFRLSGEQIIKDGLYRKYSKILVLK